ncbi:MAG: LPS-assembly protein LptD [Alphaproteobacteria bacterium]
MPRWRAFFATFALLGLIVPLGALGQEADFLGREVDSDQPVVLIADHIERDDERGITTATGNVELAQGGRIVVADSIIYNERENVVFASGNVTMKEPSGEVLFADQVELKDDLREGVISEFRALLTDGAKIAANGARRTGGNRTTMSRVVFSPCELCPEDPERAPLWQVKAKEVVHDQVDHDIAYYDAWLEFFGVPVVYTPYFQHSDPTVKRRTGVLSPTYGSTTALGYMLTVPYYIVLEPWRDLTISPTYTTNESGILALQYRELTETGSFSFEGSITRPNTQDPEFGTTLGDDVVRGHIRGEGEFDIDDIWRAGFLLERASDATYLARYNVPELSSRRTLVTSPYVEGFDDRNHASMTGFYFQGLDADDVQSRIPFVMPLVDINLVSEPGRHGSFFTLDANGMALNRRDGADSRRVSVIGGWHLPYIADTGEVYKLSATLRGDAYSVSGVVDPDDPSAVEDGLTGRIVPELSLEWRYPLIARSGTMRTLFEPIVQAIASPYGGNPESIPNEDSQDLEFDDTNLFSSNRFTGLDRIEVGPRVNYGFRLGFYGAGGGSTTILIGQGYRLREDDALTRQSGLERNFSDYVGRILISPASYLDIGYRFQLDAEDFSPRRTELDVSGGPRFLRLSMSYLQIEEQASEDNLTSFASREEVLAGAALRLTPYWRLTANARRDLTGGGRWVNLGAALTYEDECLLASLGASRSFTQTRDVEEDTSFVFRIIFKGVS